MIDAVSNEFWPKALNKMGRLPGEKKRHAVKVSTESEAAELLIRSELSDKAAILPQSLGLKEYN